jgi:hypothetical protein
MSYVALRRGVIEMRILLLLASSRRRPCCRVCGSALHNKKPTQVLHNCAPVNWPRSNYRFFSRPFHRNN